LEHFFAETARNALFGLNHRPLINLNAIRPRCRRLLAFMWWTTFVMTSGKPIGTQTPEHPSRRSSTGYRDECKWRGKIHRGPHLRVEHEAGLMQRMTDTNSDAKLETAGVDTRHPVAGQPNLRLNFMTVNPKGDYTGNWMKDCRSFCVFMAYRCHAGDVFTGAPSGYSFSRSVLYKEYLICPCRMCEHTPWSYMVGSLEYDTTGGNKAMVIR